MTLCTAGRSSAPSAALVAVTASMLVACGPTVGPPTPSTSSTSSTSSEDATTGVSSSTSSTTTIADGSTLTAADSSSSGGGLQEYVGHWSQGTTDTPLRSRSFAPCPFDGYWGIEGALPEVEECNGVESMYLRVLGELVPAPAGGGSPTLIVHEVLQGPCWQHECDGGDPCDCTSFEALCAAPPSGCDLVHQHCPRGEKCMPWANDGGMQWNATRCTPLANRPGQIGDPCTVEVSVYSGIDDCDVGLVCWNVDIDTSVGTCVSLCDVDQCHPDPFCEDPSTTCASVDDGAVQMCLPTCDPLAPDCAPGNSCQAIEGGSFCLP